MRIGAPSAWETLRQRQLEAATSTLHEAIEVLADTRGGGGLTVVFSAVRELYPWRQEQAVHDVQDRLSVSPVPVPRLRP
jgi:hypothetical protein